MINEITVEEQIDAKHIELDKLCNFNTYQEVKDSGQHALSTRWVVTNKDKQVKARLVARGFEEEQDVARYVVLRIPPLIHL